MDERLRIYQRLAKSATDDIELQHRYIRELERTIGFEKSENLINTCDDIKTITVEICDFIRKNGDYSEYYNEHCYFWIEAEYGNQAEGLCISPNTRLVAREIVRHFGSNFDQWSSDYLFSAGMLDPSDEYVIDNLYKWKKWSFI